MKRGRKYVKALEGIDRLRLYTLDEAVNSIKEIQYSGFDESLDLSLNLNLKKSHSLRDVLSFPNRFGAEIRVLVFAKGEHAEEARAAGVEFVGAEDLVGKIKDGFLDFDVAVATPNMMPLVGKLGPILGRRGLMPNPKTQTVTLEIERTVRALRQGRVEFRADKQGVVHLRVGRLSMESNALIQNVSTVISEVSRRRPADLKGLFIKSGFLSSTMGPGLKFDVAQALEVA